MSKLFLGSRGSPLALAQSRLVIEHLQSVSPETEFEVKIIRTEGDQLQSRDDTVLPPGKGIFTTEIEDALLRGEVDLAVHSLKDLPTEMRPELLLAAITERADARDTLVSKKAQSIDALPEGAIIATGSPRRSAQLSWLRPDLRIVEIRGNIDTRLRKLRENRDLDGIILAAAGLQRLQPALFELIATPLSFDEMLPAPGQGALAIQVRADDQSTRQIASLAHHPATCAQVIAERAFLTGLGGGCFMPIAAYATMSGENLKLDTFCWMSETPFPKKMSLEGHWESAEQLGYDLAAQIES